MNNDFQLSILIFRKFLPYTDIDLDLIHVHVFQLFKLLSSLTITHTHTQTHTHTFFAISKSDQTLFISIVLNKLNCFYKKLDDHYIYIYIYT